MHFCIPARVLNWTDRFEMMPQPHLIAVSQPVSYLVPCFVSYPLTGCDTYMAVCGCSIEVLMAMYEYTYMAIYDYACTCIAYVCR